MDDIEIRAYGRTELAQLYFPHLSPQRAYCKLRYWIDVYPGLRERLQQHGYRDNARIFMPAHVQMIFDTIGEPG